MRGKRIIGKSKESEDRVVATGGSAPPPAPSDQDAQRAGLVNGGRTSPMPGQASGPPRSRRRDVLKRAGAAAVASAGALTLLDATRAEATTGLPLILGATNDANLTTSLVPTAGSSFGPAPLFAVGGGATIPLRLVPSSDSAPPTFAETGSLFVDSLGRLWYCRVGGLPVPGGSPATWVKLAK